MDNAAKITKVAKTNPRRKGSLSHKRWTLLRNGMTVAAYVKAVTKHTKYSAAKAKADLKWDAERGNIKVSA